MLRWGSLFAGIGGLDLGLEATGACKVVWQAEIDPYCRRVLAARFPDAQLHGDVRSLGPWVEPVDGLAGGFPCTDVSKTGYRAGLQRGTRSGLWHEFHRLIRQLRPRWVLVENVTGLYTSGLDVVLGDLAAVGYDAEWTSFRAADLGAPHERPRIFLVAYPHSSRWGQRPRVFGPRWWAEPAHRGGGAAGAGGARPWPPEPRVGRVAHGLPSRVDRVRALGNAVVPQAAEVVARAIVAAEVAAAPQE